jgi:hypothetical protein
MERKFDLLVGLLLECGDDLRDRLVLLRVEALLPPHHEIGTAGAERRHGKRRGKNDGTGAHGGAYRWPSPPAWHRSSMAATRSRRERLGGLRDGRLMFRHAFGAADGRGSHHDHESLSQIASA